MNNRRLVWSDEKGDQRKNKESTSNADSTQIQLKVRRLTSGKGRTVIELSDLPNNKKWCQELARNLKKKIGVGGSYKGSYIEIHGEKLEAVTSYLNTSNIKWKKIGG